MSSHVKVKGTKRHQSVEVSQINAKRPKTEISETEKIKTKKDKIGVNRKNQCKSPGTIGTHWKNEELLAEIENIPPPVAKNIVHLFDEDNTIPFIARYRQDMTDGMTSEKLRQVRQSYDLVKQIQVKAESLLKTVVEQCPNDAELVERVKYARTIDEIDFLGAPFKKENKSSLASRAKKAGLEEVGRELLDGTSRVDFNCLIIADTPGRQSIKDVRDGVKHIIADIISKDTSVLEFMKKGRDREIITLQSSVKKNADEKEKGKYQLYHEFSQSIQSIKDHQILAINRAESLKIVSVKINVPPSFFNRLKVFCRNKWLSSGCKYPDREHVFEDAFQDSVHRLLSPFLSRQIRSDLTHQAERSAIGIFSSNLKNLLLTAPVRGKVVAAIDPGIKNGCKLAIVSPYGRILHLNKLYISNADDRQRSAELLADSLATFKCETIGLGNGTYSRETEGFLSKLIQSGRFRPLDVRYTVIDEQGVSIYSCSPAAESEFPGMDPTLISAVSLARRLQDPLAELVKVEPRHLGVGMYQHDVPDKKLSTSLDDIVSECVSFVGVDINTASLDLLRRVAGLSKKRAEAIAIARVENGPFLNREQILKVKGIGSKTYQQCAGFVRIIPETAVISEGSPKKLSKKNKECSLNPLDNTEIHPEDYEVATTVIADFKLNAADIGSSHFIYEVKNQLLKNSTTDLMKKYNITASKLTQITDALLRETDHDLRNLSQGPLFRSSATSLESIKTGDELTGVVRNVVQFGAFVDVGVGVSGLIHSSSLNRDRSKWVQLGDKVKVRVNNVDVQRKRLGLIFQKKI